MVDAQPHCSKRERRQQRNALEQAQRRRVVRGAEARTGWLQQRRASLDALAV